MSTKRDFDAFSGHAASGHAPPPPPPPPPLRPAPGSSESADMMYCEYCRSPGHIATPNCQVREFVRLGASLGAYAETLGAQDPAPAPAFPPPQHHPPPPPPPPASSARRAPASHGNRLGHGQQHPSSRTSRGVNSTARRKARRAQERAQREQDELRRRLQQQQDQIDQLQRQLQQQQQQQQQPPNDNQ